MYICVFHMCVSPVCFTCVFHVRFMSFEFIACMYLLTYLFCIIYDCTYCLCLLNAFCQYMQQFQITRESFVNTWHSNSSLKMAESTESPSPALAAHEARSTATPARAALAAHEAFGTATPALCYGTATPALAAHEAYGTATPALAAERPGPYPIAIRRVAADGTVRVGVAVPRCPPPEQGKGQPECADLDGKGKGKGQPGGADSNGKGKNNADANANWHGMDACLICRERNERRVRTEQRSCQARAEARVRAERADADVAKGNGKDNANVDTHDFRQEVVRMLRGLGATVIDNVPEQQQYNLRYNLNNLRHVPTRRPTGEGRASCRGAGQAAVCGPGTGDTYLLI